MDFIYLILALIVIAYITTPSNKKTDESELKDEDDVCQENNEYQNNISRPEAPDYVSILLSDTPIDDMTAYYMRQENDKDLYFTYIEYSPSWSFKRETRFNIDKGICQSCGKTIYLNSFHCHHKNYNSLFNEDLDDLESLCWSCHQEEHNH